MHYYSQKHFPARMTQFIFWILTLLVFLILLTVFPMLCIRTCTEWLFLDTNIFLSIHPNYRAFKRKSVERYQYKWLFSILNNRLFRIFHICILKTSRKIKVCRSQIKLGTLYSVPTSGGWGAEKWLLRSRFLQKTRRVLYIWQTVSTCRLGAEDAIFSGANSRSVLFSGLCSIARWTQGALPSWGFAGGKTK